ncbi:MAG: hypothetical protein CMI60_13450 [Parvibaculum sp.]|nr:hypothetical protein [Parvibaculum sp.]
MRTADAGPLVHFALFPTPLGGCGIAWCGDAVVATFLPERTNATTAAHLASSPAFSFRWFSFFCRF